MKNVGHHPPSGITLVSQRLGHPQLLQGPLHSPGRRAHHRRRERGCLHRLQLRRGRQAGHDEKHGLSEWGLCAAVPE